MYAQFEKSSNHVRWTSSCVQFVSIIASDVCVLPSFVNACVYIYYRNNGGEMKSGSHITHSMRPLYFSLSLFSASRARESANKFQHFFCARSQPSKRITDNYPARQNSNTRNDIICYMRSVVVGAHTHTRRGHGKSNRPTENRSKEWP